MKKFNKEDVINRFPAQAQPPRAARTHSPTHHNISGATNISTSSPCLYLHKSLVLVQLKALIPSISRSIQSSSSHGICLELSSAVCELPSVARWECFVSVSRYLKR